MTTYVTQRRLLATAAVVVVALALVYVARPAGHQPPYDANLVRLAESELEGYCAGEVVLKTQGEGDAGQTAACRKARGQKHSAAPNMPAVERAFCQAIVDGGWEGGVSDCLGILAEWRYWPTYDGGLTNAWNRARPYPHVAVTLGAGRDGSRTGGRQGNERPETDPRGLGGYGY